MGEFEIKTMRDKYDAARQEELEQLIDPNTGELSLSLSKYIDCPLCGKNDYEVLFKKKGYPFVRCNNCTFIYSNPQPDEKLILECYETAKSNDLWIDVLLSEEEYKYNERKFGKTLQTIEKYAQSRGRILDIGCSIGLFLKVAKGNGWDCTGLELNDRAISYAREQSGLNVVKATLEQADFAPESFDVVTMFGVLEHIARPSDILKQIHRILKKAGLLAIEVPNVNSLAARIMHEKTFTFDGRNHLQYFSVPTLKEFLVKTGYHVAEYHTEISSLEPILHHLSYNDPYFSKRPYDDLGLSPGQKELIEETIYKLGLGYRIFMFAKKAAGS